MQQLTLPGLVERRGGKREKAGRKRQGERERVSHQKRPRVTRHVPLLVTLRVRDEIPSLQTRPILELFGNVLKAMQGREGFRVVAFCLLSNHVHLLVEADSNEALSSGMHSLGV